MPNRVGSGQYAIEILRGLERLDQKNEYTILLPSLPLDDMPKPRKGWSYRVLKPNKLWTRIALPLALYSAKQKPDLIFSPTHYIPRFSPVKRVCAVFDLAYLHFPEMFKPKDLYQLKNWTKYSVENADHIFAISKFTKKDLLENYSINEDKITVTYLGYDQNFFKPVVDKAKIKEILKRYKITQPYIIYIGTIQPRKNLERLIHAFASLYGRGPAGKVSRRTSSSETAGVRREPSLPSPLTHSVPHSLYDSDSAPKLVIVGKTTGPGREGWMFKEISDAPKKYRIEDQVIFTGFAPTKDLPALLSASKAFVLPSLWEGFGMTPLEAMACGTVVIVSNISSLPEVVGESGILIDPYSIENIVRALNQIKDDKLRQKKIQLGLKQAEKFNWDKCTRETLAVLEKLNER